MPYSGWGAAVLAAQIRSERANRYLRRTGKVTERVTWTNKGETAVSEIVFNAHAHYTIPDNDIPTLAKILEILRMSPSEAMSFEGPALNVAQVKMANKEMAFHFQTDNQTALVVPLPKALQPRRRRRACSGRG